MSNGIYAIRRRAHLLTNATIRLVIQSLVLSNLDYCPVIWSSASKQELGKLQLAQNKAARLALHCSVRTSVDSMHARLSWMRVNERLAYSLIMFLNNVYPSQKPFSLFQQLLAANQRHDYSTRHASNGHFTFPMPKTNALKKTVMYRAIAYWRVLPPHLTLSRSTFCFKRKLKAAIVKREITLE